MLTREDQAINAGLFVLLGGSQLALLLLPLTGLHPAWALPLALLTNAYWALLHEAIHGHLFGGRVGSERGGRVLGVLYGAPFHLLRRGHLLHHAYSRTRRERTEVYDDARVTWGSAAPRYYAQILGGLYVGEVLAGVLLALLPARALRALAARLDSPDSVLGPLLASGSDARVQRLDALTGLAMLVLAFWLYDAHWGWLLAALLMRAVLISFFDNSYHYGTRLDDPRHALNFRAPGWLGGFLLHFNRHGTHHRNVHLGWRALGRQADEASPSISMREGLLRQLKGPIAASRL